MDRYHNPESRVVYGKAETFSDLHSINQQIDLKN